MKVAELRELVAALPLSADDDDVVVLAWHEGLSPVMSVRHEPQSHDDGGNVTSTGGTLWLAVQ